MSITPTDLADASVIQDMPSERGRRRNRRWRLTPGEESVVRSLPIALYRTTLEGGLFGPRHVNPALASILGYAPVAFVENGEFWPSRIHHEDLPRVLSAVADGLQIGSFSSEYRWLCADGSERIFLDKGLVVPAGKNIPPQIHGTCFDITDRRRLDQQLLWARRLESLELFTQDFIHDLKNKLVVVIWNLDGMMRAIETGISDGRERDRVTTALAGAEACGALIERFHKIFQPSIHCVRSLDLSALLQRMQDLFATLLGDEITLEIVTASGLASVYSDQVQLESILIALVTNAGKEMPDGGTVRIEATGVSVKNGPTSTRDFVDVTITDTAPPADPTRDADRQQHLPLIRTLMVQDGGELLIETMADGRRALCLRLPCHKGLGARFNDDRPS